MPLKYHKSSFIIYVFSFIAIFGCNKIRNRINEEKLIGKWEFDHLEIPLEYLNKGEDPSILSTELNEWATYSSQCNLTYYFYKDKSLIITQSGDGGSITNGNYELLDNNKLVFKNFTFDRLLRLITSGNYEKEIYLISDDILKLKEKASIPQFGYPNWIYVFKRSNGKKKEGNPKPKVLGQDLQEKKRLEKIAIESAEMEAKADLEYYKWEEENNDEPNLKDTAILNEEPNLTNHLPQKLVEQKFKATLYSNDWIWKTKPKINLNQDDFGRIILEFTLNENGKVTSVNTKERYCTDLVETICKEEIKKITFIKINSSQINLQEGIVVSFEINK